MEKDSVALPLYALSEAYALPAAWAAWAAWAAGSCTASRDWRYRMPSTISRAADKIARITLKTVMSRRSFQVIRVLLL